MPDEIVLKEGVNLAAGNLKWDGGLVKKNQTFIEVSFNQQYNESPLVLLIPYWFEQNAEVKHVDTIVKVTNKKFAVGSENVADNYYLMWLAVR